MVEPLIMGFIENYIDKECVPMKITKRPYSRATIICAHILKYLITTVPMLIGCAVVIYAVCAFQYQYRWAALVKLGIELVLGGGLFALGAVNYNYFES